MQAAWTGRVRLKALGARARAERTSNILYIFVTLDVSKLSGWLNANACCRVERRACDAGSGAAREGCGRWVAAATASTGAREGGRAAVVMAPAERAAVVITVERAVATVVAVAAVEGQHQEHTAVERVVGRGARVPTAAPMAECRTLRRS